MADKPKFIRKNGKVIPVGSKKKTGSKSASVKSAASKVSRTAKKVAKKTPKALGGFALLSGAAVASSKIRRKGVEAVRGKGKTGTGSNLANTVLDLGIAAGIISGVAKFGGPKMRASITSAIAFTPLSGFKGGLKSAKRSK